MDSTKGRKMIKAFTVNTCYVFVHMHVDECIFHTYACILLQPCILSMCHVSCSNSDHNVVNIYSNASL